MNQIVNYPLFTVIIPQKDRSEFLYHTLRTCMIQDYPNFEIIVSDDNSEDNSVEMVRELQKIDSRIRLFAHNKHLGMRDNFEFALNQVRPGYVIALGGDDGLVPGCIWRMYTIIKETGRDLITWSLANFAYARPGSDKNLFYLKRTKTYTQRIIKSEDFLNHIAKTFKYQIDECPMFYMKGVASTILIDRVKSRTKDHSFYYCPTPDGFSGVVLAGEVEDFVFTDEPLSIGGTTYKSQGKNYTRTDEKSRFEANQFFNDNIRRTMHADLASQPYSPLTTLMTADYLLTARDLPGWPGKFKMFSFEDLIRAAFIQISKDSFANEVLIRELRILREIAKQHDLLDLFEELMETTKKKVYNTNPIYGFAFTHSVRFEGSCVGINNIFDAALATNFVSKGYQRLSIKTFFHLLRNSLRIVYNSKKYKYENLPKISDI